MLTPFRLLTTLCLLACATAAAFDGVSGDFSLELPKGWKLGPPDPVRGKEPTMLAPQTFDGIRPHLLFGEEKLEPGDTLEIFAKEMMKVLGKWDRFRLISKSDLKTTSGLAVIKVAYERYSNVDKSMLRCVEYWSMVRDHNVLLIELRAAPGTPDSVFAEAEAAVLTLRTK
jgi:hypothetical protein